MTFQTIRRSTTHGSSIMGKAQRVLFVVGGLLFAGCVALVFWLRWESGPTLSGIVQLDGKLLATGSIALVTIEGTQGPGGGGGISEGRYENKRGLQPGKYRVEIRGTTTLSRPVRNSTIPSELVNEEVSIIPARF